MNPEEQIAQQFADHMEVASTAGSTLGPAIDQAASLIVGAVMQGGKVLTCGNGGSGAAAQLFTSKMINRHERERPGLPAIALNSGAATMTSVADDLSFDEVYGKQIAALGHPGDLLFVISCTGQSQNVLRAAQTAADKPMSIIALTGGSGGELAEQLRETDIEIRIPASSVARIEEMQLLVIHCLCELIDTHLMG